MRQATFLEAIFWESVQNLPLIAGFVGGLSLWHGGCRWAAVACAVTGSVVGALVIRLTESRIVEGHDEPLAVVLVNMLTMSILTVGLVAYLSASWSNWKTDLGCGAVAGAGGALAQDLAAGEPIGIRHCIALGLAAPIALAGTRGLASTLPAWVNIVVITAVATLIISLIDYGPTHTQKAG